MILCKDVVNISELGKQTVCTSSLHFYREHLADSELSIKLSKSVPAAYLPPQSSYVQYQSSKLTTQDKKKCTISLDAANPILSRHV